MKIYSIPQKTKTLIFDIDGTLYTNPFYVFEQVDVQIRHFAHLRGISEQEARLQIQSYRRTWSAEHNGAKISLGNTFTAFGVPIETSVAWREALLEPSHFLHHDEKLHQTLVELSKTYSLIAVTNNPVLAARRTLLAIGVADILTDIIGLDTCSKSKPAREPLEKAAQNTGASFAECLSIGDRYDIDLALPLSLGMGGILVTGVEEVYQLPEILRHPQNFSAFFAKK